MLSNQRSKFDMNSRKVQEIIRKKRIPLNLGDFFDHYSFALGLSIPLCYALFEIIINKTVDTFLLTLGLVFLLPALLTFIYFGPKQLKLKELPITFSNNTVAYTCIKETFDRLAWPIISTANKDFISALRPWAFKIGSSGKGQEVSVFIENGLLYIISLHYPNSQAQFWDHRNAKNTLIFEKELRITASKDPIASKALT